tara:strand:- start:190 stop:357 length:168 start_codon:yes stop_codon:yes gene_type:complete
MNYEFQRQLEQRVMREYLSCPDKSERRKIWDRFCALVALRPEGMVIWMEQAKGLR